MNNQKFHRRKKTTSIISFDKLVITLPVLLDKVSNCFEQEESPVLECGRQQQGRVPKIPDREGRTNLLENSISQHQLSKRNLFYKKGALQVKQASSSPTEENIKKVQDERREGSLFWQLLTTTKKNLSVPQKDKQKTTQNVQKITPTKFS